MRSFQQQTHILSVLVENKPGVLARISGMFSRRGFNIDSLAVGPTNDSRVSRMTVVVRVSERPLAHIIAQLDKLVNVLHAEEIPSDANGRELLLIKVAGDRSQILEIAGNFASKIIDACPGALTLEATGTPEKLQALIEMLEPIGILEMARTGLVALDRGASTISYQYEKGA